MRRRLNLNYLNCEVVRRMVDPRPFYQRFQLKTTPKLLQPLVISHSNTWMEFSKNSEVDHPQRNRHIFNRLSLSSKKQGRSKKFRDKTTLKMIPNLHLSSILWRFSSSRVLSNSTKMRPIYFSPEEGLLVDLVRIQMLISKTLMTQPLNQISLPCRWVANAKLEY